MKIFFSLILILLLVSCKETVHFQIEERINFQELEEASLFEIKLAGKIAERDSEISGLAWYGDYLILLPQFPYLFGDGLTGSIYYIPKERILRTINSKSQIPLTSYKIELEAFGLEKFNQWGSGYEGIIFNGDDVYFVLESFGTETESYVVKGEMNFAEKRIKVDANTLIKINNPNLLPNLSNEAITFFNDNVYAIHEINGENISSASTSSKFTSNLILQESIHFPTIEYRITDATEVEPDSTFWAINYLWPGEINLIKPINDSIFVKSGVGITHKNSFSVERLIQFKITSTGIKLMDTSPIYIELESSRSSRNWEGLVKLDEIGFLIVTDKFPRTILGFVKYP
ncbi:MAG: hypothetical protein QY331_12305 [Melioribacteraceae bacterium]|nr:MAG: hypothetical protein QY331_12305 [Melioribacteraceae bacterium]